MIGHAVARVAGDDVARRRGAGAADGVVPAPRSDAVPRLPLPAATVPVDVGADVVAGDRRCRPTRRRSDAVAAEAVDHERPDRAAAGGRR